MLLWARVQKPDCKIIACPERPKIDRSDNMNPRTFLGPFFLFLILVINAFAKDEISVTMKEVLTIGARESDELFQWADVAVDTAGNIYLTDAMDFSIKKYNISGSLVQKAGRKGHGPGEFQNPRLLKWHAAKLFVMDQSRTGIQIFDENLNFISFIPYSYPIMDFRVLNENEILIAGMQSESPANFQVINSKGEIVNHIDYSEGLTPDVMDFIRFDVDRSKNFYLCFLFRDMIKKIDTRGNSVWCKSLFKGTEQDFRTVNDFVVPNKLFFKDIKLASPNLLFVLCGDVSKHASRDVIIFDVDGKKRGSFLLPFPTHLIYIDPNGYLYSRAEMGTQLKKYKMNLN